jgi:basic amino acid/polyamine antiporter, APA family
MIREVGSPLILFAVFVFGGVLSLFGALTYSELGAALPEAGGEYVYLREAYGPFWGFLYGWTQMWVGRSASIATLATGFFYYLANFWPQLNTVIVSWPIQIRFGQLFGMALILVLGALNYQGVRIGGDVQVATTIVKLVLIAGIIAIGLGSGHASTANYVKSIPAPGGLPGFFAALVAALWAYDGWNAVTMVASEIRRPARNLPISLIAGMAIIIAVYLLANAAYFAVLTPAEAQPQMVEGGIETTRVAAEMMRRILGSTGAGAVSVAAMISIFAALNGSILSGSRVPYAMAQDRLFFRRCADVNPTHRTPGASIALLSLWSAVLVLTGRYEQLFTLVIFGSWILYAMTAASVIVLRRKRPDLPRPYRVLGYPVVPGFFVLAAVALLGSTLFHSPRESLLGLGLMAAGIPFYLYWKNSDRMLMQGPPAARPSRSYNPEG